MNLALWLDRAGRRTRSVLRSGMARACCGATARSLAVSRGSPARCAALRARRPATASRSSSKNSPGLSRSALRDLARRARGGAGQRQAARRRARLHPRTFRRAGLLRIRRPRRRDRAARADCARALIVIGGAEYERLVRGRSDRGRAARRRRSRLAVLHLGHDRTAEGRDADPPRARCGKLCLRRRGRSVAPGDPILHAAPMSHGSGLYMMAHVMRRGVNVVPESGGFEPAGNLRAARAWPRTSMFAAPTMVKRLVECPADCDARTSAPSSGAARRCMSRTRCKALDRFGPRLAQIYGQGESPMTITMLSRDDIADRDHPRWRERLASAGRPFACVEVMVADEDDRPLPPGEPGEILCRGDDRHGRLLAEPGGERRGAARRLAAHRRRRRLRRRRLSHAEGPLQGPDHLRRLQHLSARGRGGAAAPSQGARGLGDRPARPRVGRGGGRLRGRRGAGRPSSTRCALARSRASSGRRTMCSSRHCRRTTTARSSRPSCATIDAARRAERAAG